MSKAKFNLQSWSINNHRLQEITKSDNTSNPNTTVGLLGLRWNTVTDTLSLAERHILPINTFITKRDILQVSSQIFDPLGLATPVTVNAKILLQEIWLTKLTWDEPAPDNHKGILCVIDITRYSHINRLLASTAYVLRLVHNL